MSDNREPGFKANENTLYVGSDDGVHLQCDWCGEDINLGFQASLYDAILAWALHGTTCHGGNND